MPKPKKIIEQIAQSATSRTGSGTKKGRVNTSSRGAISISSVSPVCRAPLLSGWPRPERSVRAQVARDLKRDERNEESQHHCGECNRAEVPSDEGQRH